MGRLLENFLKIIFVDVTLSWCHLWWLNFPEKKVKIFSFHYHQLGSKISMMKYKTVKKSNMTIKRCMQQEKLFKPIVTNTVISLVESGQLVLPKWDVLFKHIRCFPWFLKLGLDNCLILTWDIEILGWCPGGPVLPHGGKVPL